MVPPKMLLATLMLPLLTLAALAAGAAWLARLRSG